MSDRLISEGREKLLGVTEGEWRIPHAQSNLVWGANEPIAWLNDQGKVEQVEMMPADAEFIVWARNNLAALLDALVEAESDRGYYQALYYATDGGRR